MFFFLGSWIPLVAAHCGHLLTRGPLAPPTFRTFRHCTYQKVLSLDGPLPELPGQPSEPPVCIWSNPISPSITHAANPPWPTARVTKNRTHPRRLFCNKSRCWSASHFLFLPAWISSAFGKSKACCCFSFLGFRLLGSSPFSLLPIFCRRIIRVSILSLAFPYHHYPPRPKPVSP